MPSKLRELYYLCLKLAAVVLWAPFTGTLRHGRTWGELKRLSPREAAVMLVPVSGYALAAGYVLLVVPDTVLPWAVTVWMLGAVLGGTLIVTTTATSKFLDWRMYHH
ncbi:hypothetical protein [Halobacterium bonnevillei]|uniref:Uncharacterized protein n=1 Tax=Halobacterium bonnevillei TaxID=2692200 RepID=A0A6B0SG12_9EURY|nr:hypothetical protein [Halobacterium bonnevillei]MXR19556.1 hypothetical protein [Halobacterium bonnevillei]